MFCLVVLIYFCTSIASGCFRSNVDLDKKHESHQGTEVPEYVSNLPPSSGSELHSKKTLNKESNVREEGNVEVNGKWEFPVALTRSGKLWGTIDHSRTGKRILSFRGITHVLPPVGELRFRHPVLTNSKWEGIREVKTNGHVCPQHMYYKSDTWIGDENCLWLNVFTPDLIRNKKRPVIVWIHGGNFVRGSASEYEPTYLLDESDVVLVAIQYRLGMFGFLSTEDENAPGNYGMFDQIAGLRWVRSNIEAFSGNPDNIIIMGQQAGAASVHYLMLSPLSRGLFHKAVSLSGSALCWWASLKRPLEKAKKLARLLECPSGNNQDLIICIKRKSMMQLMNTHPNFYEWRHLEQAQEPMTAWSPRVDSDVDLSFMPQEPIDLMVAGSFHHIPWIVGITDDEGAFKASAFFSNMRIIREFEEEFDKLGPLMFGFHDGQSEAPKISAQRIKEYYWKNSELNPNDDNAKGFVNAISDSSYSHPIDTASKIHAMKSKANVFVYHFGYRGQNSLTQLSADTYPPNISKNYTGIKFGVGNSDDLIYLFPILSGIFRPLSPEDLTFSQKLIRLLVSFAQTGNPHIADNDNNGMDPFIWHPVNAENASHLNIGNDMKMDQGLPNHERMSFWQSMPVYWNADRSGYKSSLDTEEHKDEL